MVQTIQAKEITLLDLETSFGLQLVEDEQFFREWQDNLPLEYGKPPKECLRTLFFN
jgi:hypothetical protein